MKLLSKLAMLSLIIVFFSCGDDDDDGPAYDFKDQIAQGTINGKSWTFESGRAEISNGELSIDLSADSESIPCETFFFDGLIIFFYIDNETGTTELNFDLNDFDNSKTATFYDPEDGESGLNIIATEGAIEILSITDTEITGRLDIRDGYDNSSSVNGNFTIELCE